MRVNWLRAKSRRDRWVEENVLLASELEWSWRFFVRQEVIWRDRSILAIGGYRCYALKQADVWTQFAESALAAMKPVGLAPA